MLKNYEYNYKDINIDDRNRIINSILLLKEKINADGTFNKMKARFVANGARQDKNIYDCISSPTASIPALFAVIAIAASENRAIGSADITGAYLHAKMDNSLVYVKISNNIVNILKQINNNYNNYINKNGDIYVKLQRALYGCIESARLWYDCISNILFKNGFVVNNFEKCIFNKYKNNKQITIVLYVDDVIVTASDDETVLEVLNMLKKSFGEITMKTGIKHEYLGMIFNRINNNQISVSMDGYVNTILKDYNITGTVVNPAGPNLFNVNNKSPLLDDKMKTIFHTIVAKLLYVSKRVRIDIATPISFLCTRVQNPSDDDWSKLQHVLKYLNGTRNTNIILSATKDMNIEAYVDASWGCHHDGKGHTGIYATLGTGPIISKSIKQKSIGLSSTEAEIIGLTDSYPSVSWLRSFLIDQGYKINAVRINQDNNGVLELIKNGSGISSKTKHFNIKYFAIKEKIDNGELVLVKCHTNKMLADMFTKPLQGSYFKQMKTITMTDGK